MHNFGVSRLACARIPTSVGEFELCLYGNEFDQKEHLALIFGEVARGSEVTVRIHSECFTGDVLGSQRCDCGPQLRMAMDTLAREGRGVLIYLRQEGRGIGLLDKLRAYNLQDQGFDTVEANLLLGHEPDERDYRVAAAMLRDLGIKSIRLLTNNPEKVNSLRNLGIQVTARLGLQVEITPENAQYLRTKVDRLNHLLILQPESEEAAELPMRRRNGRPA